jgi:hypothetical protein
MLGPVPADLDHTNQDVRESLTDWMSWLKSELGFMGWRFDFTKVCWPAARLTSVVTHLDKA